MKLTTIIGTAIAAVGLAASGATVAATGAPTLAPTVAPSPSASASPSASPSPGGSWGFITTCGFPGTAQGGSLIITFTNGTPDSVTIDGNVVDVTSNPFTSEPYSIGEHSLIIEGFDASFNILACDVVTVTTTCSATDSPTGSATFSGVTVGAGLNVMDSGDVTVTSNPFTVSPIGVSYGDTYVESNESGGLITLASGTFTIAVCAAPPVPVTGAGL
jgi:hypothetical protein